MKTTSKIWTRYQISMHAQYRWAQRFEIDHKESLTQVISNSRFLGMLHSRGKAWYVFVYEDAAFLFSWEHDAPDATLDTVWPVTWAQRKLEA